MILNELYQKQPEGYQDISQDNSQPQQGQLRKTRLTLKQLSKLRQMSDVRQYEYNEKLKNIRKQYAPPAQPPGL
jgi:ribosomal protein L29